MLLGRNHNPSSVLAVNLYTHSRNDEFTSTFHPAVRKIRARRSARHCAVRRGVFQWSNAMTTHKPYQPKTGQPCHCKRGQQRDFAAIRAMRERKAAEQLARDAAKVQGWLDRDARQAWLA